MQDFSPLFDVGEHQSVSAGDLDQVQLGQNETTIFSEQVNNDKRAFLGHGGKNRQHAQAKFIKLELVASGNGAGAAGDIIDEGDLVAAITDSDQKRVEDSTPVENLGELQEALTDDRTDRPMFPAQAPRATPGKHVEYRVEVPPKYEQYEIDPSASTARLYYTTQG